MQLPPISSLDNKEFEHVLLGLLRQYELAVEAVGRGESPELNLALELRARLAAHLDQQEASDDLAA